MPAHAAHLSLPDISGLRPVLPWHEVDRLQGVQSFHGDPARALLDLWPLFRREVHPLMPHQRTWTGGEKPIEILTACWRDFKSKVESEPDRPSVALDQDQRGYFITVEISLEDAIPQDMMLYWADLRHVPRLREFSRGVWDFSLDGLGLLLRLGVDDFERWLDWYGEFYAEYEAAESEGGVQVLVPGVQDEAQQLETLAPQVLRAVRERCKRKDLAESFARRVRRAAVAPAWVEWGRQILTAQRDLGKLWELVDQDMVESGDFDGEFFTSMFALFWCSPRFVEMSTQMFNDQMNNTGLMLPMVCGQLRGSRKAPLEVLRAKAALRSSGLRALAEALAGFNNLAEQACGVIDDDPR